ncbi:Hypp9397 [Branchiostoma lanceolatum]|uniref:Hypp9397 protein n=1 Tax=Branchiostoma lanceolatum TaxID=7740 RepID=A0A8S4MLN6_BRALA|nr:Hypp9397 [Branchiostoma lanceolatum]
MDLSEEKQRERVEEARFQVVEQARVSPPMFSAARLLSSLAFLEEKARELNHTELPTFRATLYDAKAYAQHPSLGKMVLRPLGPKEDEDVAKKLRPFINIRRHSRGMFPPPHDQFPPPQFPPPQQYYTQFYPQQVPVRQLYQPQPPPQQLVPQQYGHQFTPAQANRRNSMMDAEHSNAEPPERDDRRPLTTWNGHIAQPVLVPVVVAVQVDAVADSRLAAAEVADSRLAAGEVAAVEVADEEGEGGVHVHVEVDRLPTEE